MTPTPVDLESLRGHTQIVRITAEGTREAGSRCSSAMRKAMHLRASHLDSAANDIDSAIAELTERRAQPILTESKKQQAEAWEAVVSTLDEVACGWANDPGCGSDNACNTIRALAREVKERRARDAKVAELVEAANAMRDNFACVLRVNCKCDDEFIQHQLMAFDTALAAFKEPTP